MYKKMIRLLREIDLEHVSDDGLYQLERAAQRLLDAINEEWGRR